MSDHRRIPEAAGGPSLAGQARTEPGVHNIAPAPVADVMFDQLEYLAAHAVRSCPLGCADCVRFTQVKDLLLVPFLSSRHHGMPDQKAGMQAEAISHGTGILT